MIQLKVRVRAVNALWMFSFVGIENCAHSHITISLNAINIYIAILTSMTINILAMVSHSLG